MGVDEKKNNQIEHVQILQCKQSQVNEQQKWFSVSVSVSDLNARYRTIV